MVKSTTLKEIDINQFLIDFIKFADQQTTGQKIKGLKEFNHIYKNSKYKDLDIKFSVGQGIANITPWIAFTGYNQTPKNGLYPNICYVKENNSIHLLYGASLENSPEQHWHNNLDNKDYKIYSVEEILQRKSDIKKSLDNVIQEYNYIFSKNSAYINTENQFPLNQILYGPPGTGKTFNTIDLAVKIINQAQDSHEKNHEVFKNSLGNQIEFITFHQNYSYEDFIQGLKPDLEGKNSLSFNLKDGLFKKISDRALNNYKASKVIKEDNSLIPFDKVFNEFISSLNEDDEPIVIKMKKAFYEITDVTNKAIYFKKQSGDSNHSLSINSLQKMYETGHNNIISGGLQPYYDPLLDALIAKAKTMKSVKVVEPLKNYVIIIDEINRANISRVFGELITLIEEDKRYSMENEMSVTLPSGESFVVPPNLYIIGTMNTADKSIALLDIALRRRFEFVGMYTDYTQLKDLNNIFSLEKINQEIEKRRGIDFTIGHAFFVNKAEKDLSNIFNKKVIPLLSEYFPNKEEIIIDILKAGNIKLKKQNSQLYFDGFYQ